MSDYADIHATFENNLFQIACQDVLRIVSILSLDSTDIIQVKNRTITKNIYEKITFFTRFLYLVFIKGFTPTIFDVLPYWLWKSISIAIYIYRLMVLPFILRLSGYGKYTSWEGIGTKQPSINAKESQPLKVLSLSKENQLSKVDFGDEKYELFIQTLYKFTTYLSPHSHSPLNPFTHNSYPGNFFDHLTGVYKILLAWHQPQYVVRAGLFHSVYGTFDYRYGLYDLRDGRQALQNLIGEAAEEISFTICTSDRIGLMRDLIVKMYGDNAKLAIDGSSITMMNQNKEPTNTTTTTDNNNNNNNTNSINNTINNTVDGNPYPKLVGILGEDGFAVRNHITQKVHILPPDLFAQFSMVMIADFMEQGVIALGAADNDICMFRFMRYRFWSDFILYLSPYLRVKPTVWSKYMGVNTFIEPIRDEVVKLKQLWLDVMQQFHDIKDVLSLQSTKQLFHYTTYNTININNVSSNTIYDDTNQYVLMLIKKYPYLAEPYIILSASLKNDEKIENYTRKTLAKEGLLRLEEWGMLTIKCGSHGLKEAMQLVNHLV